jgi:hypothetical protein
MSAKTRLLIVESRPPRLWEKALGKSRWLTLAEDFGVNAGWRSRSRATASGWTFFGEDYRQG